MIATSAYDVVLSLHIMAVVVAFGVTFAYPLMFIVAARHEPRAVPVLHRIEYTLARVLINPVLVVAVLAGVYLASDGKHWKEFFVQWGLAAAIVIGGVLGSVLIPASKKAEALSARDLGAAGGEPGEMSDEYRAVVRRITVWGSLMSALVLVTILFMAIKP
jgi:uncharacterized membrane protein